MGETKKAGERVFLGGGSCLIGEVKKSGELDFLVGDSSLIGADTRKDDRFPIKGTDPELDAVVDAVVASDIGIARSRWRSVGFGGSQMWTRCSKG